MVDLMLQNSRVPTLCLDHLRFALFVETCHSNGERTPHRSHQSRDAETTLEEGDIRRREQFNLRIEDHMKINRLPPTLQQLSLRYSLVILGLVFDHCHLQRLPDL